VLTLKPWHNNMLPNHSRFARQFNWKLKKEVVPGLSDSGQAKHSDEVESRGIPELVWWTISGTFEIDAAEMKVPGWGF
jgi:hypothetical protein